MKKKKLSIVLIIIAIVFLNIKVNAATCDSTTKKELKKEAQQVNVSLELNRPDSDPGADKSVYTYDLKIQNISANIYLEAGGSNYTYKDSINGEITVGRIYAMGGYKVKIKIYGSTESGCGDSVLRNISLYVPYYNKYSDREECKGFEGYKICKTTTNTENISEEKFLEQIEKIKKEQAEDETSKPIVEEEKNVFEKFIDYYWKNKLATIPITLIIPIAIIILIIMIKRKRKNKIKIDLGGSL